MRTIADVFRDLGLSTRSPAEMTLDELDAEYETAKHASVARELFRVIVAARASAIRNELERRVTEALRES